MFFLVTLRTVWRLYPLIHQAATNEFLLAITIMTMKKRHMQWALRPWFLTVRCAGLSQLAVRPTKLRAIFASAGNWSNTGSKSPTSGLNIKMLLRHALSTYN